MDQTTNSLEYLLKEKQFSINDDKKNNILLEIIKPQLARAQNNKFIKNFFERQQVEIDKISGLQEVPAVPVQMFKYFDLSTCPKGDISMVLQSSGTTSSIKSRVPLNKITMANQTKALNSTLADYLGQNRKIFLVIDHEGINNPSKEISARTAGVRGLSAFSKKIFYLLKEEDGKLSLNLPAIKEVGENFSGEEVYVFGFTYIIWSVFMKQLRENPGSVKFNFKDVKIFHSGGWKKMEEEKISKDEFSEKIAEIFGVAKKSVHDFYGMAEQTGIIFIDCEYGFKHVPNFSQVIVRDIKTQKPCPINEIGLIEVMSVLSDSYYGQAILTEDKGYILGIDNCPCGRKGRYFNFVTRLQKAELRGCGNTFRE